MKLSVVAALLALVALAGCGLYSNGEFGPQDQRDFAKHFVSLFGKRDVAAIKAEMDPSLNWGAMPPAPFQEMFNLYPTQGPQSAKVIKWSFESGPRGTFYNLSVLCSFSGDKTLIVMLSLDKMNGRYFVHGVRLEPISHAYLEAVAFRLRGKTPAQYVFLAATAAVLLLSLFAFIQCVFTRGLRHKWLWLIFIAIGLGKISMNWANGALFVQPLAFQLFSASAVSLSFYQPWIISLSLPFGAFIFLIRRRELVRLQLHAEALMEKGE
jgi:hypothetical protein